jgi:hypothetical protein
MLSASTVGTFGPKVHDEPQTRCDGNVTVVSHLSVEGGTNLLAALVHLGGTGKYISWGVVQISLSNLIIIAVMIVMLVAAIALPFPKHEARRK